jgi:fructoselysine-6-P-deglycase FrlB-like protein
MRAIEREVASQPDCWERARQVATARSVDLPADGERVLVLGCGTSHFVAQAYARAREDAGRGTTDATVASELTGRRTYDRIVALSRSGTTTEVLRALDSLRGSAPTVVVTADGGSPVAGAADLAIVLDFADEQSVVQTRFATSALAMLLTSIGYEVTPAIDDAGRALGVAIDDASIAVRTFTFLGTGWTIGLANEAALKLREAALAWSESYPALEFRHGPISVADHESIVWPLGAVDDSLLRDVEGTGARVAGNGLHPLAELVVVQRLAIAIAERKGLDPDHPPHLSRSVVLPA